jgi:hypothetical protein
LSTIVHTLLAAGADRDDLNPDPLVHLPFGVVDAELEAGRRRIGAVQIGIVRARALQVCIALQSL